tara:strand:- start:43 stop:384 length:342 start_codon:yes stop_codon:yes gene_type:complete
MNTPQQLDLFPELNYTVDYGNATYTLDTNGSLPYTLTYSIDDQMVQAVSLTDNVDVKIYKLFPEAHMPELGTEWAACFDLKASLRDSDEITVFNATNTKSKRKYANGSIFIYS